MTPWKDEAVRICEAQGYGLKSILAYDNRREIHAVRREIAKMLRARGLSYPQIGRLLKRDHTAIMAMVSEKFRAKKEIIRKRRWLAEKQSRLAHALLR